MPNYVDLSKASVCPKCQSDIAKALLSCLSCGYLIHSDQLTQLADEAKTFTNDGCLTNALQRWRDALELLPENSKQAGVIQQKITDLNREIEKNPALSIPSINENDEKKSWLAKSAGIGALGLLVWKFKFVFVFIITKGKLLLLGLSKSSTAFSMLLSTGVYWVAWGWKFAVGLVLSIYIHEMGHVAMLRRYGHKADAPMFIPGIGAVIRLRQHIGDPQEDARIGLAGPIWGTFAALFCYLVYAISGLGIFAAIGKLGTWINLFNLLPIWQLDGGRAFHSLCRSYRWICAVTILVAWFISKEGLLILLIIFAGSRAMFGSAPKEKDSTSLIQYTILVIALTLMGAIDVPIPETK